MFLTLLQAAHRFRPRLHRIAFLGVSMDAALLAALKLPPQAGVAGGRMGVARLCGLLAAQRPVLLVAGAVMDVEFQLRQGAHQRASHVIALGVVGMNHKPAGLARAAHQLGLRRGQLFHPAALTVNMLFQTALHRI